MHDIEKCLCTHEKDYIFFAYSFLFLKKVFLYSPPWESSNKEASEAEEITLFLDSRLDYFSDVFNKAVMVAAACRHSVACFLPGNAAVPTTLIHCGGTRTFDPIKPLDTILLPEP